MIPVSLHLNGHGHLTVTYTCQSSKFFGKECKAYIQPELDIASFLEACYIEDGELPELFEGYNVLAMMPDDYVAVLDWE